MCLSKPVCLHSVDEQLFKFTIYDARVYFIVSKWHVSLKVNVTIIHKIYKYAMYQKNSPLNIESIVFD